MPSIPYTARTVTPPIITGTVAVPPPPPTPPPCDITGVVVNNLGYDVIVPPAGTAVDVQFSLVSVVPGQLVTLDLASAVTGCVFDSLVVVGGPKALPVSAGVYGFVFTLGTETLSLRVFYRNPVDSPSSIPYATFAGANAGPTGALSIPVPVPSAAALIDAVGRGYEFAAPSTTSSEIEFNLASPTAGEEVTLNLSALNPNGVAWISGPPLLNNGNGTWAVRFPVGNEVSRLRLDFNGNLTNPVTFPVSGKLPIYPDVASGFFTVPTIPTVVSSDISAIVVVQLGYDIVVPGDTSWEAQFQLLVPTPGETVIVDVNAIPNFDQLVWLSGTVPVNNGDGTYTFTFATGEETVHFRIDVASRPTEDLYFAYSAQVGAATPVTGTIELPYPIPTYPIPTFGQTPPQPVDISEHINSVLVYSSLDLATVTAPHVMDAIHVEDTAVIDDATYTSVTVPPNIADSGFGGVLPVVLLNSTALPKSYRIRIYSPINVPAANRIILGIGTTSSAPDTTQYPTLPIDLEVNDVPAGQTQVVYLFFGLAADAGPIVLTSFLVQVDAWAI